MILHKDLEYIHSVMPEKIEGVMEVRARKKNGRPRVIRCAPIVRKKPFSTLYWLIDPGDIYNISNLEAMGYIEKIQTAIHMLPAFKSDMITAHHSYQRDRLQYISNEDRIQLEKLGLKDVFNKRGVGGMENFTAVKCLHSHFAHHISDFNPVGNWVNQNLNTKTPEDPLEFYKKVYQN